jgi:NTP pyrophosphatase (non-canonical NTP hydrolase)
MNDTTEDLTLSGAQAAVHAWISQWEEGYWHPLSNLARLTEEVGELARAINHGHGDKKKKPGEVDAAIAEELADVLFVVVTLANQLDVDLTAALRAVMTKYDIRDAGRWTPRATPEGAADE